MKTEFISLTGNPVPEFPDKIEFMTFDNGAFKIHTVEKSDPTYPNALILFLAKKGFVPKEWLSS